MKQGTGVTPTIYLNGIYENYENGVDLEVIMEHIGNLERQSMDLPEDVADRAIRPKLLEEYVGQPQVRSQMEIFIKAAKLRGDALDHLLIFGPPGLGKTTLANIVANYAPRLVRCWKRRAIWQQCSLTLNHTMYCLLMRSTVFHQWWKRCCIRQWKITNWIS